MSSQKSHGLRAAVYGTLLRSLLCKSCDRSEKVKPASKREEQQRLMSNLTKGTFAHLNRVRAVEEDGSYLMV